MSRPSRAEQRRARHALLIQAVTVALALLAAATSRPRPSRSRPGRHHR